MTTQLLEDEKKTVINDIKDNYTYKNSIEIILDDIKLTYKKHIDDKFIKPYRDDEIKKKIILDELLDKENEIKTKLIDTNNNDYTINSLNTELLDIQAKIRKQEGLYKLMKENNDKMIQNMGRNY